MISGAYLLLEDLDQAKKILGGNVIKQISGSMTARQPEIAILQVKKNLKEHHRNAAYILLAWGWRADPAPHVRSLIGIYKYVLYDGKTWRQVTLGP